MKTCKIHYYIYIIDFVIFRQKVFINHVIFRQKVFMILLEGLGLADRFHLFMYSCVANYSVGEQKRINTTAHKVISS